MTWPKYVELRLILRQAIATVVVFHSVEELQIFPAGTSRVTSPELLAGPFFTCSYLWVEGLGVWVAVDG